MTRWLAAWRPAIRIARRDAWRHKGRSLVVLVMVALPVLAVVAMDAILRTAEVSAVEGLDRQLGSADALVQYTGVKPIQQHPTELSFSSPSAPSTDDPSSDPGAAPHVAALLPRGTLMITLRRGETHFTTPLGQSFADAIEVDLSDPMTDGLFDLEAGRLPRDPSEVVVSSRIADRGLRPGHHLRLGNGTERLVVGTIRWVDFDRDSRLVVGAPGGLHLADQTTTLSWWLVDTPGPVGWSAVKGLNHQGFVALSRAVVKNPPPPSAVETDFYGDSGLDSATLAVIAIVVAMALLEVVLLAGPAFAVGIRRQRRVLALVSATGGTRRDVRRVVLGGGLVLGAAAAVVGVAVGLVVARAALPFAQTVSSSAFGPFDVSVRDTVLVAGFGMFSAVLAAMVPAFSAARQDVVAALAGRRGQTRAPLWSPILGSLLLAGGAILTYVGATRGAGGETVIAGAAILAVVGMVLMVPIVVAELGRTARLFPLPVRFAVRDAARQRGRTAPAVAAVAATVAGVVALGIGAASDAAQEKALYTPRGPVGGGVVAFYDDTFDNWKRAQAIVRRQAPGARVQALLGAVPVVDDLGPTTGTTPRTTMQVDALRARPDNLGWSSPFGSEVLIGARTFDRMQLQIPPAARERAHVALAAGKVVFFRGTGTSSSTIKARVRVRRAAAGERHAQPIANLVVPAVAITAPGTYQPANAVIPRSLAQRVGYRAAVTALVVSGTSISRTQEDKIIEALHSGVGDSAMFYVERGFRDNSVAVVLLVLGSVGGLLVLGGTLTATFLALSDARPDFATMRAVGARPATRRAVAAAYAAAIGLVGAVLGAAVGFIPGIAVTYPLTSASWAEGAVSVDGAPIASHFVDIPWTLVGAIVVGLPAMTAVVVGIGVRGRLPMVSRLS